MVRIIPPSKLPERQRIPGLPVGLVERILGLPRWAYFIAAMVAIPIAVVPIGGIARYTTASPSYCLSCHATGETPNRAPRSLVHASVEQVTCVDCHAKTGQVVFEGYVRGFMAEPDRITQNCVRCHSSMPQTDAQTDFKRNYLGIRITHRAHIERGATCTTCHANVAHDLAIPQTNRPRMQACNTCHAASDNCAKCHTQNVPTALPPVPAPGWAESMSDGRVYYLRICAGCHGAKGDAQAKVNLSRQDVLNKLGQQTIFRAIEQGHGDMPAFGNKYGGPLNGEQVRSIFGYLASEAVGATAPDGKALYDRTCVVCHGESGDKVAGVQHTSADFWASRTDGELFRAISHGQGGMPALGKAEGGLLTNQEINAVLAYLQQKAGVVRRPTAEGPDAEALYQQNCVGCHGANGRQAPTANLASKEFVGGLGDEKIFAAIVEGRVGMPALGQAKGGKLADNEVSALVQYVKSLAGLAPRPAAGAGGQGKSLYTTNCAGCHGANGNQTANARLGAADFQKERGDDGLAKATAEGKGGMPPMGKAKGGPLSDDQVAAIIAYLKTMAGGQ